MQGKGSKISETGTNEMGNDEFSGRDNEMGEERNGEKKVAAYFIFEPAISPTRKHIFVNVNSSSGDRRVNVGVDRAWKNDETLVESPAVED